MRTLSRPVCCLAVLAMAAGLARAENDPKAVVNKAIKATGGEEKISKLKATKMKFKGTIDIMGNSVEFSAETTAQQPNQFRNEIKLDIMGQSITIVQVLNKDKAWNSAMGMTMELEGDQLDQIKEQAYGDYIESLVPLLNDKQFTLAAAGEEKVNGKAAAGVKVSSKGHKDVTLYFDKDTGLLVKSKKRGKDMGNNEIDVESFMSNFKDVSGVKSPTKILVKHDGQKFIEGEVSDIKLLEKVEDSTFDKP
jgi:hypothetical protein